MAPWTDTNASLLLAAALVRGFSEPVPVGILDSVKSTAVMAAYAALSPVTIASSEPFITQLVTTILAKFDMFCVCNVWVLPGNFCFKSCLASKPGSRVC